MKRFFKNTFSLFLGIYFSIMAIIAFIMAGQPWTHANHVLEKSYGGDAYTGIQNAAAATANNIQDLESSINGNITMFFVFIGILLIGASFMAIWYYIGHLPSKKEKN